MDARQCHDALFEEALIRRLLRAFSEVCAALGAGFDAAVYTEALCVELAARGFRLERAVRAAVTYGGTVVGELVAALVVESCIIVDVRTSPLGFPQQSHLRSCLRATGLATGLLLRFGERPAFRIVGADGRSMRGRIPPPVSLAASLGTRSMRTPVVAVRESPSRDERRGSPAPEKGSGAEHDEPP
jgi:GxxExxY protein